MHVVYQLEHRIGHQTDCHICCCNLSCLPHVMNSSLVCEWEGIVRGDEGPVGGVAQVVSHGVKVVGVHGEKEQEKDEEVRVRFRRSRATQRETLIMDSMWMKVKDSRDDLSQCGCDT